MIDQLDDIEARVTAALDAADSPELLEEWRRATIGRKGEVQLLTRRMGEIEPADRPAFGKRINEIKASLQEAFEARKEALKRAAARTDDDAERLDVTLPGRRPALGGLHPSTLVMRRAQRIFRDMGFQVYLSPDVVTDKLNFGDLNMPPDHPARDMQDTFYATDPSVVLRTHTSSGQILAMRERHPEPVRVILPGMCYRNEQITARSEIQFQQIEGLAVGRAITFADLKGTLTEFARRLFGAGRGVRFRASYFPFTEPSAEMDVSCQLCAGDGCQLCKGTGWLEILGCGMVHPVVLRNGGYDPDEWSGFAWGMGIERVALLRHGIRDIRYFWSNDLRFLRQFRRFV